MKPHRIRMCHNLLLNYGLYKKMEIYRPPRAQFDDLTKFHSDDYVNFLRTITPKNMDEHHKNMIRFNVGDDCTVFSGMYEFCQISAGGSIAAAVKLNKNEADIAINWAGGLHHAKRTEASGFCYINDIVLCILELLKVHQRVLYIDIDVHHGDGVEEAFYTTDRVMTLSLHKYGEFFPGTGSCRDNGADKGKNYALNFPLKDGIDDESYLYIFKEVISKVMAWYRPGAVVLQCGADSLAGDRLGCFNLSTKGHAGCVEFIKSFNIPLVLLGGGGYTIRNVARCWAYETAVALGTNVANDLPYNEYFEYYSPDFQLNVQSSNMENQNSREYLDKTLAKLIDYMRNIPSAPSVAMNRNNNLGHGIPDVKDSIVDEEMARADIRVTENDKDKYIERDGELDSNNNCDVYDDNGGIDLGYSHIEDDQNSFGIQDVMKKDLDAIKNDMDGNEAKKLKLNSSNTNDIGSTAATMDVE